MTWTPTCLEVLHAQSPHYLLLHAASLVFGSLSRVAGNDERTDLCTEKLGSGRLFLFWWRAPTATAAQDFSEFVSPEWRRQSYGLQLNTGSNLTNQIRGSLSRRSVSDCSDLRGGSCGWYFLYTLATFTLELEGFVIPVSLPHPFTPHNPGNRVFNPWTQTWEPLP